MRSLLLVCAALAGCTTVTVISEEPDDRSVVQRPGPIVVAPLVVEPFVPLEPAGLDALQQSFRATLSTASGRTDLLALDEAEETGEGVLVVGVLRDVPRQRALSQAMELVPTAELSVFARADRGLLYTATLELERGTPDDGARGLRAVVEALAAWLAELLRAGPG